MSALATTIPVPCGAFMPVFVIGELFHTYFAFLIVYNFNWVLGEMKKHFQKNVECIITLNVLY